MPATYEPIATTTLGSAANSITFSNIPGTYTDLKLITVIKSATANSDIFLQFNSDTGTNYSRTYLMGNGSSVASARQTSQSQIQLTGQGATHTTLPCLNQIDIFSYAGSTNKTVLGNFSADYNNSAEVAGNEEVIVGLWRSTSAITSIKFYLAAGNMATGTTATLYGILKA